MRQIIAGLIACVAFAATMATAAPAQACVVTDPCGNYGYGYRGHAGYGYGHGYGYGVRERLPNPQYYWADQGPTYTGPGNYAPRPFYQERTVIGSRYYGRPYGYRHANRYGYRHAYRHRGHYHAHRHYGHRAQPRHYRY